jgi:hypothetical protein
LALGVPFTGPFSTLYQTQDNLGQYSFGYSGGPSSKHEVKTADGVTRGGYSYIDANGIVQSTSYVADPVNGFRVAATNLPAGPAVQHPNYIADSPDVAIAKAAHFAAHAEAKARLTGAPVVPYVHGVYPSAPLNPDGTVADTHEVAAAKAAHFAAIAEARSRSKRSLNPAPLNADGTVADTPEVMAAKAVHFAAHAEAKGRSLFGVSPIPLVYAPYYYTSAPLKADGTVDDTPEVKAAKAAHFAAHYYERTGVPHFYSAFPYLYSHYGGAPLNPDGTVADTPEVAAAKIAHFAAHADAHFRSKRSAIPAPLNPDGTVDETPEVKAAKAIHFAAHAEAKGRSYSPYHFAPVSYSPAWWYTHAPLKADGTVDETPEVKAAKAIHFAAHAAEKARSYPFVYAAAPYVYAPSHVAPAPLNIDGTVADTPEIVAAKAAHFAAHVEARHRLKRSVIPAPLNADGTVAETPEVQAAKAVHFAAHAKAKARSYSPYTVAPVFYTPHYYAPAPLKPDGTVDETPEVKAATAIHLAAHAAEKTRSYPFVHAPAAYYYTPYVSAAPLNADGTVADTPEVAAAKAVHFAAYNQALYGH